MAAKFVGKPVEAMRFMGTHDSDIEAFAGEKNIRPVWVVREENNGTHIFEFSVPNSEAAYEVRAHDGSALLSAKDWLVKDDEDRLFCLDHRTFQRSYEPKND